RRSSAPASTATSPAMRRPLSGCSPSPNSAACPSSTAVTRSRQRATSSRSWLNTRASAYAPSRRRTRSPPSAPLSALRLAAPSEPWLVPNIADYAPIDAHFASPIGDGVTPYLRDPQTLARPWATPGTPGLEHRIGGLEKSNITGNVSYDAANHDLMVKLRAEKI